MVPQKAGVGTIAGSSLFKYHFVRSALGGRSGRSKCVVYGGAYACAYLQS
jgi:hypothetical protein